MSHLQLGTTLLHKYRIDRVRLEAADSTLYDGTDTMHARPVCIKVLRSGRLTNDEAHAANVVDIGRTLGMPYVVTSEWGRAADLADDAPTVDLALKLPRGLKRSSPWPVIAIVVAGAITGVIGWSIGQRESRPAPTTIATDVAAQPPATPTKQAPIVAKPPATHTEEVSAVPTRQKRRKPASDPLTL